jgi:SSS family solute:Na+ symporter
VQLLATAYGIVSQLAPPIVAAMYWRRATTPGVVAGLLAGWATAGFFYFNPALKPFGMHEGVVGLLVHIPVLVGVSLATRRQDPAHAEGFCGSLDRPRTEVT